MPTPANQISKRPIYEGGTITGYTGQDAKSGETVSFGTLGQELGRAPSSVQTTPAGILSSAAGKSVVNTKITPVITAGTQAQTTAAQNQEANQQTNATQAEADAANATPADMLDPLQARLEANQKAQRDALRQEQQLYKEMAIANTEATGAAVRQLQGAWATVQRQQQETNRSAEANITTAGLRAGTARYAPQINEGMIAAQKSYGIQKLQEIDAKYSEAISSANAALAQGNLQLAQASAKASQDYLQQAAKEIQDQITNAQKIASDAAKARVDARKEIDKVVMEAAKGGATPEQLAAIGKSTDMASAVTAAGDSLRTGDYAEYKREAMAYGQVPVSPNTYYMKKFTYSSGAVSAPVPPPAPGYAGQFEATIGLAAGNMTSVYSQKAIKDQLESSIAAGDYKSAAQAIYQSTAAGLSGENKTKFENASIDAGALTDLNAALKAYKAAGGDMNLAKSVALDAGKSLGLLTQDKPYAALAAQLDAAFQQYRQNMTGAAFSKQESGEYQRVRPGKNGSFALNEATIEGATNFANSYVKNAVKAKVGQGGVEIIAKANAPTPSQQLVQEGEKAKTTVNGVYTSNPAWRPKIDALYNAGQDDLAVVEYLKLNGVIQ